MLALELSDKQRLQEIVRGQQQVILAIDGMQPEVGHEVLWVLRDCLSGEILLARTLLSATNQDARSIANRGEAVHRSSDCWSNQRWSAINSRSQSRWHYGRVPHGLCHFHYLRAAAKLFYEADRHAKKELKKQVRGIGTIERSVGKSNDAGSNTVQDYCQAVRSALTSDGRPPLEASGLKLQERLTKIYAKLRTSG